MSNRRVAVGTVARVHRISALQASAAAALFREKQWPPRAIKYRVENLVYMPPRMIPVRTGGRR